MSILVSWLRASFLYLSCIASDLKQIDDMHSGNARQRYSLESRCRHLRIYMWWCCANIGHQCIQIKSKPQLVILDTYGVIFQESAGQWGDKITANIIMLRQLASHMHTTQNGANEMKWELSRSLVPAQTKSAQFFNICFILPFDGVQKGQKKQEFVKCKQSVALCADKVFPWKACCILPHSYPALRL